MNENNIKYENSEELINIVNRINKIDKEGNSIYNLNSNSEDIDENKK